MSIKPDQDKRQREVEKWFRMCVHADIIDESKFRGFCRWVKGKQQNEVFRAIHKKKLLDLPPA